MKKFVLFCLVALCLCSCGTYKRLAYLQDMSPLETYDITQKANPRIAVGDELTIKVSSSFPQLVAPFNVSSAVTTFDKETKVESFKDVGEDTTYKVNQDGKIDFPVLGSIYVEGMTPEDLENLIEEAIKDKNYVSDPSVKVTFFNFTYYTLGEIGNGAHKAPSGEVNVLQAIAMAGDLSENAQRDNVWVIRTTGDTRKVYTLNMKSRSLFDSPAFYLQQDDVIYVAPKDTKQDAAISNVSTFTTTVLSILSTIGTLLLWFAVYTK